MSVLGCSLKLIFCQLRDIPKKIVIDYKKLVGPKAFNDRLTVNLGLILPILEVTKSGSIGDYPPLCAKSKGTRSDPNSITDVSKYYLIWKYKNLQCECKWK